MLIIIVEDISECYKQKGHCNIAFASTRYGHTLSGYHNHKDLTKSNIFGTFSFTWIVSLCIILMNNFLIFFVASFPFDVNFGYRFVAPETHMLVITIFEQLIQESFYLIQ